MIYHLTRKDSQTDQDIQIGDELLYTFSGSHVVPIVSDNSLVAVESEVGTQDRDGLPTSSIVIRGLSEGSVAVTFSEVHPLGSTIDSQGFQTFTVRIHPKKRQSALKSALEGLGVNVGSDGPCCGPNGCG